MAVGSFSIEPQEDWIDELVRRQDNIDPIRRIPNGALFQGTLINGNLHLNKPQRVGAVILGLFALTFGCYSLAQIVAAVRWWSFADPSLYTAIFCPFALWFGWKITVNAVINNPGKRQIKRADDR